MPDYKYVILGGGMSGDAAVKGLREVDPDGSLALISAELDPPYDRPPLTKGLWKDTQQDEIWRRTEDHQVSLHLGTYIVRLDPDAHELTDSDGQVYRYEKLLLATGGNPRELPFGEGEVIYYRTFQDYQRLRDLAAEHDRFAVVGGGFIGSELAAALTLQDKKVTMIFPEPAIGGLRFPDSLGQFLNEYYSESGVELITGQSVVGIERLDDGTRVTTDKDMQVTVDAVAVGIGIVPNTVLAETAGLEVDNGIVVDKGLRTSNPDIYAAGDVASFHNPALGFRLRVEHEDNANQMGELAGKAMAGADVAYNYLPYFYSDLFDLGYEAVGVLDGRMEIVEDWDELGKKGVVYFLHGDRVRGVLLWNVWGQLDAARELIADSGPIHAGDLTGRLGD